MSASDDAGASPNLSGEHAPEINNAESGSTHTESTEPTSQGCDSYHDRLAHGLPTNTSSHFNSDSGEASSSRQSFLSEGESAQTNNLLEDTASSDGSGMGPSREGTATLRQAPGSTTELSDIATPLREQRGSSSQPVGHTEQASTSQQGAITLREALHQTAESFGRVHISNVASSRPRRDRSPHIPRGTSQDGTAPLAVPSETRQPSSGLNPIAPVFSPRRSPQDLTLPRWQPDSEVTYCPICHTQFSFFVRKHHCRKCGRVVCNACSPHKITIPHQYIVRPPSERGYARISFLGDEGGIADFSALGGGEQVRLCNPCVPDPNTTPPQTQHSASQLSPRSSHPHQRSQSSSNEDYGYSGGYNGNYNRDNNVNRYLSYPVPPNQTPDAHARSRSVTMNSSSGTSRPTLGSLFPPANRVMTGTPPAYYPHPYASNRHSSILGHRFPGASLVDLAGPSSSSSTLAAAAMAAMNRPLPPPPQIPEEDECPICHRELPPRDLPDFEARRESHIESCITAHSTYSPRRDPSGRSSSHSSPAQITRRTGMFPYLATEKDCVDSAECTICLEEFEVGVPMARLECLCRFHRSCITAWFVNHPGRCPVHQHDSFGY
ncbi:FYVE-domain-containing protein [Jackrogersella minutella]|nr:FYVE-domain-containing protein [Jackrogersella minutella]